MPKIDSVDRWAMEIKLAEMYKDEKLGKYRKDGVTKAGENIEYYESGFSRGKFNQVEEDTIMTLNIVHAVVNNILPALYFKNPNIIAMPMRSRDATGSFYAKHIVNYFYKSIMADKNNRKAIWDSYVIGKGYTKIGYATKFGMDIKDEEKKKKVNFKDRLFDTLGIKKIKEEEEYHPEIDKDIVAEFPYIKYVSPFDVIVDPRASCLENALWWAHCMKKTVDQVKNDSRFKNTEDIVGNEMDERYADGTRIPLTQIDAFKTVYLYEIHYRQPDGFYLLYLAKDSDNFHALYHEKSIYEMDDWQLDEYDFVTHEHEYYKKSEITKVKVLQDRFTATIDNILEQVDRFVPKIIADENAFNPQSKKTLEEGDIGSICWVNKTPRDTVYELGLQQFKGDLQALNNEIINLVTIQTGITKAQLLGVASGETATAETIAMGGQTLRLADMQNEIQRVANSQAEKLWSIIKQFVPLEDLEVITGENGIDPKTGQPIFNWLKIDGEMAETLRDSNVSFKMEVGSTQKLDMGVIRKSIENFVNILSRTDVISLLQQQGKKVDLAEIIKMWLQTTPEVFTDINKIIQDINQNTPGLLSPDIVNAQLGVQPGGTTSGSRENELKSMMAKAMPNVPQTLSEGAQR